MGWICFMFQVGIIDSRGGLAGFKDQNINKTGKCIRFTTRLKNEKFVLVNWRAKNVGFTVWRLDVYINYIKL